MPYSNDNTPLLGLNRYELFEGRTVNGEIEIVFDDQTRKMDGTLKSPVSSNAIAAARARSIRVKRRAELCGAHG